MFSPFSPVKRLDRDRFEQDMQLPPAGTRYVMHFTPRSGSSWLADLATQTKSLGAPDECFNPNFMPNMSMAMNAADLVEYKSVLMRRRNMRDVFGFQITYHQMIKVFGSAEGFAARFPVSDWASFWLIREDIVAQAVSLFKMVETTIAHAPQTHMEEIAERDRGLVYDGEQVQRWLTHVLKAERGSEAFFAQTDTQPLRMSYERNLATIPRRVVNVMCGHLGLRLVREIPESTHRKIATGLNADFATQFRADFPNFLRDVAAEREERLARISDYGAVIEKARADLLTTI